MSYYTGRHFNAYGIPLDNRADFTKLDWSLPVPLPPPSTSALPCFCASLTNTILPLSPVHVRMGYACMSRECWVGAMSRDKATFMKIISGPVFGSCLACLLAPHGHYLYARAAPQRLFCIVSFTSPLQLSHPAIHRFAHETATRVPLTDWAKTSKPDFQGLSRPAIVHSAFTALSGFQARPVIGGVYAKLLDDVMHG